MSDADGSTSAAGDPRTVHRIDIGGSATGPVIAGNHNLVVDAQHGSRVTVLGGPERPRPRRRPRVELLPRRLSEPVGREDVTKALAAAVRAGGPAQLWGPPGIGKTTLLRHVARLLPPGPDGVVFVSGAHRDVVDLAQEVFEACYEAPGYAPTRAELRRLMAGVRVTAYVDDANLTSGQLTELMDAAPDATFVFASDERSLWGDGTALRLDGLAQAAGLELLARELGGPLPEGERDVAVALWRAASGLPLPLLRAAAVARSDPAGDDRLPRPGEVAALLPMLLDQLAADAAAMGVLHLLATLDGAEVAPTHVGVLAGVAEPEAVCDRLVRLGLARAGEHGYGSVADTVPVLRRRFPAPYSAERLCGYFTSWASLRATTPPDLAAHGRLLQKVAELAESAKRPDLAVRLARAASPGLARALRFGVWGQLLGRGWSASRAAGDRRAEAYFLHEEAIRALLLGRRVAYAALLAQSAWLGYELGAGDGGSAGVTAADPSSGHAGGAPDSPGGDMGADASGGQPDFDIDGYTADNGLGPAGPRAPADHGSTAPSPDTTGGDGSWGGAPHDGGGSASAIPGDGGTSGGAPPPPGGDAGGLAAPPSGAAGGSWGGGATASSGGAAAGAGASAVVASIVALVVACALVVGLGYAISTANRDEGSPTGGGVDEAVPTPTFSFSLPAELTEGPTETDPFSNPPGCDQRYDAQQAYSETMSNAPVTNPAHDQVWAAAENQFAEDLAAAAQAATDPAIRSAIEEEASDTAALAAAIANGDLTAMDRYIDEQYEDATTLTDLCYG
ncbi:ATP-binding protein [Streptomyces specialis]|uniref:ATP-binding protein n=1 Tax=Streptomyces specialis TaxID=498367 RepID=UPI00073ED665|nr:ATP-binding protein [Streptomyces specialis]